ncbi:hypothetical protein CYMTET_24845 [Cymbomonas tetramitiformis]|uniref:EGF-like domain-containing protein n=1 Tax=Cymbomonas tetramitiformis TaxID=36881 RepID=A0AAE0KZT0_9CHLO|nr:hypothetical protein CYMTET_24845 [Cymbomonas tetramitiformis]
MPSSPPPPCPLPPPAPPPSPPPPIDSTITGTFAFETFSSQALTAELQADFLSAIAESAAVSTSSVTVNSVYDGAAPSPAARRLRQASTLACVSTTVTFFNSDVDTGADPATYLDISQSDPAAIFAGSPNTKLSQATVQSWGWMASGDVQAVAGTPGFPQPPPESPQPPPISPPPPTPCSSDPCFPGVRCEDSPADDGWGTDLAGFRCLGCPSGFDGDGVSCMDLDEVRAQTTVSDASPLPPARNATMWWAQHRWL